MMNNRNYQGNTPTIAEVQQRLQDLLPPVWRVQVTAAAIQRGGSDAVLELQAPDGRRATIVVEIRRRLDPVTVPRVVEQFRSGTGRATAARSPFEYLVAAPYLSERTRQKLRENELNYVDFTGNVCVRIDEPAIYIQTQGADKDPDRKSRPARSLRGVKAGQIVRVLVDFRSPLGVRQIAQIAQTSPGNVSRVLDMLERETLIRRTTGGGVQEVMWDELLEAWTRDYSLIKSNRTYLYLDPRGIDHFLACLRALPNKTRYAITGSLAAGRRAPVAPARLAVVFVSDVADVAAALGLVATEVGANVLLVEPIGQFVFERTTVDEGLTYVAPSQIVADLLTGLGRNPTEADELLGWMRRNEDAWRT